GAEERVERQPRRGREPGAARAEEQRADDARERIEGGGAAGRSARHVDERGPRGLIEQHLRLGEPRRIVRNASRTPVTTARRVRSACCSNIARGSRGGGPSPP